MASIEIGLDAYNGMLERIKDLEIKNVALELETKKKDATISDLQEKIDIVKMPIGMTELSVGSK